MQQYDQRRLRLFAVVLFLGIMAANLGRYLIFDGLYLWDARLRWQECAYVLHGLNPFDVMHSRVPSIESIGWLDASLGGTVPWAYVLGNVINPGFLPYSAMCVYILALDFIAPLVTALCMGRFLLRHRYVQDKYMAVLASLLVFAPSMWANAVLFGNQSGIVCCCVTFPCVLEDSETLRACCWLLPVQTAGGVCVFVPAALQKALESNNRYLRHCAGVLAAGGHFNRKQPHLHADRYYGPGVEL